MNQSAFAAFLFSTALLFSGAFPSLAQEQAVYRVVVSLDWTKDKHPLEYPDNAHWSRLIAIAHAPRYSLFHDGHSASSGLSLVATNGRTSVLEAELEEARRRGRVGVHVLATALKTGSGKVEFQIEVTEKFRCISFATMLAPSPDWFTGVTSKCLNLENGWSTIEKAPLWVWDAGSDSGESFKSKNSPTQPLQSIRLSTHGAFLNTQGLAGVGEAVFALQQ